MRIRRIVLVWLLVSALLALVSLLPACGGAEETRTTAPLATMTTQASMTTTAAPASPTTTTAAQAATTTETMSGVATTSLPARTAVGTIAFARVTDLATHSGCGDLWVVNTDGSGLRQLTATSDVSEEQPSWSPDGSRIAYAMGTPPGQSTFTLRVMNADGSGNGHLTGAPLAGLNPKWSSDGTRIVFGNPATWNPAIMNADGSGIQAVTSDETYKFLPNWLPDGTVLYLEFGAAIDRRTDGLIFGDIFRVNVDGSGLTKVTKDGRVAFYAVSPDGTQLAIHDNLYDRLVILPVDGEKTPRVLVGNVSQYVPTKTVSLAWSPDGKAIAFASSLMFSSLGGSPIYIVNADGSGLHEVPNTEHSADVAWRPE